MEFNETDLHIISNALRVAGERFKEHSASLKKDGYKSLAAVFDIQQLEVERVYKALAEHRGIAS